jgi:hypothetical protein
LPGAWVVVADEVSGALLRLSRDAEGKELLPTLAEQERRNAEHARKREQEARRESDLEREKRVAAEKRVRELEAELGRRGGSG